MLDGIRAEAMRIIDDGSLSDAAKISQPRTLLKLRKRAQQVGRSLDRIKTKTSDDKLPESFYRPAPSFNSIAQDRQQKLTSLFEDCFAELRARVESGGPPGTYDDFAAKYGR